MVREKEEKSGESTTEAKRGEFQKRRKKLQKDNLIENQAFP